MKPLSGAAETRTVTNSNSLTTGDHTVYGRRRAGILSLILCALCALCVSQCHAMDRFAALSQIESGDNDYAIGPDGEVSRYQIMPAVWRTYTVAPLSCATNSALALKVARAIMRDRLTVDLSGRKVIVLEIDDARFYMFWHRPGRVFHPTKAEWDRAQRFANLCQRR